MKLRERIGHWSRWPGWRRYSPAAGSVAVHVLVGLALVSMLAASGKPQRLGITVSRGIEVTLVAETPNPRAIRPMPPVSPRLTPKSERQSEALPEARPATDDPRKDRRRQEAAAEPAVAGGAAFNDEDGVYLGESAVARSGVPLGLRSLLETDPCKPKEGLPRGDCEPRWAEKLAQGKLLLVPTAQDLRRMYPGIIPPCQYRVGCEGGEWISMNGTRSVFDPHGSPMMSGPGGLGGINDLTERLGFNPDHTDPGFGD
jgi:hypothetical protein